MLNLMNIRQCVRIVSAPLFAKVTAKKARASVRRSFNEGGSLVLIRKRRFTPPGSYYHPFNLHRMEDYQ